MIGFLKKLLGFDKPTETDTTVPAAPYKVETSVVLESAKCGCGRSPTGKCVGLHKLTDEEWAVHADNPAKTEAEKPAATTAKKKAPKVTKPTVAKIKAATTEKKPKAPRKKKAAE